MCPMDYVPFLHQRDGEGIYRMDIKGLIQAALIGGIVMYGTQQTLSVRLDAIQDDISEVKSSVSDIRKDLYVPRR